MVNKTNLILVITTGLDPQYPSSYLHFWDDLKLRFVGRINQFDSDPISISHAENIITVAAQNKVCCLKMGQLETFQTISTSQALANSTESNVVKGLHSLSQGKKFAVATCSDTIGGIQIHWFTNNSGGATKD